LVRACHGGDADADRDLHLAVAQRGADLLGTLAQRLGKLGRILERRGQHDGKAIAGDARATGAGRHAIANQLTQQCDHAIAHRHAVIVVDDVQAVDIDEQCAPRRGLRRGRIRAVFERAAHALFEGRTRQQTGQRVIAVSEHRGDAAGEQFGQARMMRREFRGGLGAKQRQHADAAAIGTRNRTGQHAVGDFCRPGLQHHAVDDRGSTAHLRHRQQMPVRLGQQCGVQRRFR
jgi:hypothetical protein